jgi:hypothetical protein
MPNLPAPAPRVHLIPPELDSGWETLDPHEEAAMWAGFDGWDPEDADGLDTLDRLSAQIRAAEVPPAEPRLPTAEWLRVQAAWFRALDDSPEAGSSSMAIWLSVRIDALADEWERFGAETVRAFRRAETADLQQTYLHHQDIGKITGLGGESRVDVLNRIAAFS